MVYIGGHHDKSLEKIKASIPLTKTEPEQMWLEEWGNQLFVKVRNINLNQHEDAEVSLIPTHRTA